MNGYKLVAFLTAMLFAYTVVIGFGLLMGNIAAENAFTLIALACAIPALASYYGFFISGPDRDWSLLLSGLGWTFAALALIVQQAVLRAAQLSAAPGEFVVPPNTAAGTIFFAFLAFACLLASAVLGYQNWSTSVETRGS